MGSSLSHHLLWGKPSPCRKDSQAAYEVTYMTRDGGPQLTASKELKPANNLELSSQLDALAAVGPVDDAVPATSAPATPPETLS